MSKTSKTTQENKPPAWAEPLFRQSASDALNLYKSGAGGNTYTGSTVAPLSGTTMQGINQLAQAGLGWNTAGTRPLYQGLGAAAVSNPYLNPLSGVASGLGGVAGGVGDIAGGQTAIGTGSDYRDIYGRAQAPTSAAANLSDYASGKYLAEGNPYYRQRLDKEIADANAMIQSQFSGAGRYGSQANQRTIADNTSNMLMQGLENDYNRQQANQLTAAGMIDQANQAALGTQLGAISGLTGVEGQNIANRLSGAGLQGNLLSNAGNMLSNAGQLYSTGIGQGLGAADAMSNLDQRNFQNQLQGASATLQAGGLLDQQAQKQLSDEVAKWYSLDNQDWTRLGMLQTAATGAAGPYGTQIATERQPVGIGSLLSGFGSLIHK
jgi:hypothetical protein